MLGIVTSIDVQARVANDDNVITWFDLHTSIAPTGDSQLEPRGGPVMAPTSCHSSPAVPGRTQWRGSSKRFR